MMKRRHPETELHGRDEAAAWLAALKLEVVPRWYVEATLEAGTSSRFHLNVYAEEWGFAFHHRDGSSWIRITDIPFVHGRDDFALLPCVPDLSAVPAFVGDLEAEHAIEFQRSVIDVRSNIAHAPAIVRTWLALQRSRRRTR